MESDPYDGDLDFDYELSFDEDNHSISLTVHPRPLRRMSQDEYAEALRRFLWKYSLACVYDEERGILRFVN